MDNYKNYCKSCIVTRIGDFQCSYQGQIRVLENFRVNIEIFNVERDICLQTEKNEDSFLCIQTDDKLITAKNLYIRKIGSKLKEENFENPCFNFNMLIEAVDVCWGNVWCVGDTREFLFDSFICNITDGEELIGLTPYEEIDDMMFYKSELALDIKAHYQVINTKAGFSFQAFPNIRRIGTDLKFGVRSHMQYQSENMMNLEMIKQKICNIVLLFEILCGELVTTTQVRLYQKNEIFDYLGNCNFPIKELGIFKRNNIDSRSFIRKSLFKVSDLECFIDEATEKFCSLIKSKGLAFEAYKQVLLDDSVGISTTNKFLKTMQIVEGMERTDVDEERQIIFEKEKETIIGKLENLEDKEFVRKYCRNNGDNFSKCLQKMTKRVMKALSEISNKEFRGYYNLLENIKNDRDVYTHASHTHNPILTLDEIQWVIYCYKVFFRVEVLLDIGMDIQLIRKRLSYDRRFVAVYDKLFNLKIKPEEQFSTGEYDRIM